MEVLREKCAVQMSYANLYKHLGEVDEAKDQYKKAIALLESYIQEQESDEISKLHLEAMYILKTL
jgi:tetratricopeptide (TPR) repeat protein